MTAKEALRILYKDGWEKVVQKGCHIQLKHAVKKRNITVTMHNKDLAINTLNSIEKHAQIEL